MGTERHLLSVPSPPPAITRTVSVTMPNGVPVVGARVGAGAGLTTKTSVGFITYYALGSPVAVTDADGAATVSGYPTDPPASTLTARVTYDDGVLVQSQTVTLDDPHTDVQLEYMPWLTVSAAPGQSTAGDVDSLAFKVRQPRSSRRRGFAPFVAAGGEGVRIALRPPTGWSAKDCRRSSKMSGKTNSAGKLTLKVCASRSGLYRVTSHGAVPTGDLMIRVKGAPPMAPQSLSGKSPHAGSASVSWARPVYSGGFRVTSYRLTATCAGQKVRQVVVKPKSAKASALRHTFAKLARYKTWRISVAAVTRRGVGSATVTSVRVA
jgi:hypothetical protein